MLFWFVVYDVWKCFVSTTHISVLFHYFSHWAFVDRLGDRKPLFDFIVYLWKTPVRNLWLYLWYPVIVWTTYYRARRVNMTLLILRDACARAPMKARLLFLSFPIPLWDCYWFKGTNSRFLPWTLYIFFQTIFPLDAYRPSKYLLFLFLYP